MKFDDESIKAELTEIDNDPTIDVESWEADFIETVLFKWEGQLTARQTSTAANIIEKYK